MAFGTWLQSKLTERGWTQREAAKHLGVGHATVGRWLNGRRPEAVLLERIADIFVADYDYVATLAGVRPRELLNIDPDSATARLMPLIEQIDWESRPGRIEEMEAELRYMVDMDRKRRQIAQDRRQ
ncbi:MAG: helix-turn-helix transcriptional regulator [Thermomicrobiales bacterium]